MIRRGRRRRRDQRKWVDQMSPRDLTGDLLEKAQPGLPSSVVQPQQLTPGRVDLLKPGTTVISRNAKIVIFKGSMRLAVYII
uniref:Single-stranded DNA binding protein Ssb-like OB fold domain-containing protein n=1 Tax=Arundo donax TaxID=35708 RepID=A0A0A9C4F6_ARUDO